jgi:uncharacterized protein YraI
MDMDKRLILSTTLFQSAGPAALASSQRTNQRFYPLLTRIALWLGAVLLLVACGPGEAKPDSEQLRAETARIAQEYSAGGSLDQAREAINGLQVANPHQYLVLQAEDAIATNADPQMAAALVKLAVDMRLSSASIGAYATQNGLIAAAPTPSPQPTLVFGPRTTTPVSEGAAPVSAPLAEAAAVTSTEATTATQVLAAVPPISDTTALAVATPTQATTTAASGPSLSSSALVNVRSGPGVDFPVVDSLDAGENAAITGKNGTAEWWEIALDGGQSGWVLAQLVTTSGDVSTVAVPADLPAPPAATPAAVAAAPEAPAEATATPLPVEAAPPAEAAATAAPAASSSDQPYFKLIASRMWSKAENGDCRGQHLLRINVIDANGVRLNGVRLKGIYTGEVLVTGSQGKGDGVIEYDLYSTGEGFTVIQNDDGREAGSDRAEGFTTQSREISQDLLIAGGYCTNATDCQIFYDSWGCNGHHSWEATFQRNY